VITVQLLSHLTEANLAIGMIDEPAVLQETKRKCFSASSGCIPDVESVFPGIFRIFSVAV
jgi:hypothetical protein